jgi:hypothetical protein
MSVEHSPSQLRSARELRILNPTTGAVVTPHVVEFDTARESFTGVAQRLKGIASCGIWLNPYRGIPRVSFMPELDLIYLDEGARVLCCIASFRQSSMDLPEVNADSAVVLAAGRLSAAGIQVGQRLEIRDAASGVLKSGRVLASADEGVAKVNARDEPVEFRTGLKTFFGGLLRGKSDRRRGKRHMIPGSVAYFSIGSPQAQEVRDISTDGFYVRTQDRWSKGTSLLVGLEIINPTSREVEAMISVRSKVVRTGLDGVGFVYDDERAHRDPILGVTNPEHLVQLQRFLQRIQRG